MEHEIVIKEGHDTITEAQAIQMKIVRRYGCCKCKSAETLPNLISILLM